MNSLEDVWEVSNTLLLPPCFPHEKRRSIHYFPPGLGGQGDFLLFFPLRTAEMSEGASDIASSRIGGLGGHYFQSSVSTIARNKWLARFHNQLRNEFRGLLAQVHVFWTIFLARPCAPTDDFLYEPWTWVHAFIKANCCSLSWHQWFPVASNTFQSSSKTIVHDLVTFQYSQSGLNLQRQFLNKAKSLYFPFLSSF